MRPVRKERCAHHELVRRRSIRAEKRAIHVKLHALHAYVVVGQHFNARVAAERGVRLRHADAHRRRRRIALRWRRTLIKRQYFRRTQRAIVNLHFIEHALERQQPILLRPDADIHSVVCHRPGGRQRRAQQLAVQIQPQARPVIYASDVIPSVGVDCRRAGQVILHVCTHCHPQLAAGLYPQKVLQRAGGQIVLAHDVLAHIRHAGVEPRRDGDGVRRIQIRRVADIHIIVYAVEPQRRIRMTCAPHRPVHQRAVVAIPGRIRSCQPRALTEQQLRPQTRGGHRHIERNQVIRAILIARYIAAAHVVFVILPIGQAGQVHRMRRAARRREHKRHCPVSDAGGHAVMARGRLIRRHFQ